MELKTLHTFVTVVQEGSISAAARQLHMTQPPLSAHIAQLEAEMHTCLFQRGGRHIRLTPAGEELYRRAVPILEMARLAKEEVSRYGEGVEDTIHMGVVSSVAGLVGWLPAYCQAHPKVRFELFEGNTYHLLQQIRAGVLQLAIVRTPFAPGELETVPLLEESLVAVGKENWFRDENGYLPETISLAELANKPLIVYRRWEGVLSRIFERKGLRLNTFCCNDDARTTLTWAVSGAGVGILPRSMVRHWNEKNDFEMVFLPVAEEAMHSRIELVYRKKEELSQAARALLQTAEAWYREKGEELL